MKPTAVEMRDITITRQHAAWQVYQYQAAPSVLMAKQ